MWKGCRPEHRRRPSPTSLKNHSLCVQYGPLRLTCFASSLPNKTMFPFHLAKPGLKTTGEISEDFLVSLTQNKLKKSWGWGTDFRPLKRWHTLEGEH